MADTDGCEGVPAVSTDDDEEDKDDSDVTISLDGELVYMQAKNSCKAGMTRTGLDSVKRSVANLKI